MVTVGGANLSVMTCRPDQSRHLRRFRAFECREGSRWCEVLEVKNRGCDSGRLMAKSFVCVTRLFHTTEGHDTQASHTLHWTGGDRCHNRQFIRRINDAVGSWKL